MPEEYRALLDPQIPLGAAADRYFPRIDKVLNMARLLVGLLAIMAGMAAIVAYVNGDLNKVALTLVGLGISLAALALLILRGRQQQRAGGDLQRRGVFVLPEGILLNWGNAQDYLPRQDVQDFELFMERDLDEAAMLWYPVAAGQAYKKWGFDTVGLVRDIHRGMLQTWQDTGDFSVKRWKRPGEAAVQEREE